MKQFFKTIGYGLLVMATSVATIASIAYSIYHLFGILPSLIGFSAVCGFLWGLLYLVLGVAFIYVLGYMCIGEQKC